MSERDTIMPKAETLPNGRLKGVRISACRACAKVRILGTEGLCGVASCRRKREAKK